MQPNLLDLTANDYLASGRDRAEIDFSLDEQMLETLG